MPKRETPTRSRTAARSRDATRTHCCVGIVLDQHTRIEVRHVGEPDANRETFRGKTELLIAWKRADRKC